MEKSYMISDASKMVEVENHVLRYWEEELELDIPRNEMGHRFYRESDIRLLRSVKDLKEQGFQLRAIKKLLPDLSRVEKMDPRGIYQLREELNQQVMRESIEGSRGSVTPLHQARDRHGKRQKTWQERSYELDQIKGQTAPVSQDGGRTASMERLQQFEAMLRQMIRSTMEEMSRESEERICKEVTTRLQKEMNYLLMQKEELQEKQIQLLKQILTQVKQEEAAKLPAKNQQRKETAAEKEVAATQETAKEASGSEEKRGRKKGILRKEKKRKKKLFAKSE